MDSKLDPMWSTMYIEWMALQVAGLLISEIVLAIYVLLLPLPSREKTKYFKRHTKELRIGMQKNLSEEAFQLVLEASLDKALASISSCQPMLIAQSARNTAKSEKVFML